MVKYTTLGTTDLKISKICLGTMTWGVQNSQEEGFEQMDYALNQGVNFWDTAELYAVPPSADTYGKTEEIIGNWFKKTGKRNEVILATKVAGPGPFWIRQGKGIDKQNIIEAVNESLKRLQTDYIDLYQLHWPNRDNYHFQQNWNFNPQFSPEQVEENFVEVLQTLDQLIKDGKIRHIGLSNETEWGVMKYLQLSKKHNLPRIQSNQNEYSLLCRHFEPGFAEIAIAEKCGLLAWSPLATGLLTGKYMDGARPEGSRWKLDSWSTNRDTKQANQAVKQYHEIANKHGLNPSQMALAFVNSRPFVTSNIIGATSMEQLKTNIDSVNIELSDDVKKKITSIYQTYPIPY